MIRKVLTTEHLASKPANQSSYPRSVPKVAENFMKEKM
jgi:hypothetical protein